MATPLKLGLGFIAVTAVLLGASLWGTLESPFVSAQSESGGPVSNFRVASVDYDSAVLSWDKLAETENISEYGVSYWTIPDNGASIASAEEFRPDEATTSEGGTSLSYEVDGLTPDTRYGFRLQVISETHQVTATTPLNPNPTPTPTASPTPTPAPTSTAPRGLRLRFFYRTGVELLWEPMAGATKYKVEYRVVEAPLWIVDTDSRVYANYEYSVWNLTCGTDYEFRVSAYVDGAWGEGSEPSQSTIVCNIPPVFDSPSYSFSIAQDAAVDTVVGSVSATDPDNDNIKAGGHLRYYILRQGSSGYGKFALNRKTGAITVEEALDYETTSSYSLTVTVWDTYNGTDTATVTITVAVDGPEQESSPATGAPTISGTVQVGETLTTEVSDIADEDGLDNAAFSYQWVANDGSADTDIQDVTGSTYSLASSDEGKTIKVRVSFTDDAGQPGVAYQRGDGNGAGQAQQPDCHWPAHRHRNGPGGRDADGGNVRHFRR